MTNQGKRALFISNTLTFLTIDVYLMRFALSQTSKKPNTNIIILEFQANLLQKQWTKNTLGFLMTTLYIKSTKKLDSVKS